MNDKFTKPGGILDLIKGTNDHRILKNKLDILEKGGGEGSRGGKVIGHTSSGKPIYEHKEGPLSAGSRAKRHGGTQMGIHKYKEHAASHEGFTAQDHEDAYDHHAAEAGKARAKADQHHRNGNHAASTKWDTIASSHWRAAKAHNEERKAKDTSSHTLKSDIVAQDQTFGIQYRPSIASMYGESK